jgi:prophage tail gpP-like protein
MLAEIKANPTPGYRYRVKRGEFINQISERAYGNKFKWRIISKANPRLVGGPDAGKSGSQQWFFPGNVIMIPKLKEKRKITFDLSVPSKTQDEDTLVINGKTILTQAIEFIRTMDTGADQVTATFPYEEGEDPELDSIVKPWLDCQYYIGGEIQFSGHIYNIRKTTDPDSGRTVTLEMFTETIDLVDSNVMPPYEMKNVTLEQAANQITDKYGLPVKVDFHTEVPGKFTRVTAKKEDTDFGFLASLAAQRGALITNSALSELVITSADLKTQPIGDIVEGETTASNFEYVFEGRKRFNITRALTSSPRRNWVGIAVDDNVPRTRHQAFTASGSLSGELEDAAAWKRNKNIADAQATEMPVNSWIGPNNQIWYWNSLVNVRSKTRGTQEKAFTYLIRRVIFKKDAENGRTAILSLVDPRLYTSEDIAADDEIIL